MTVHTDHFSKSHIDKVGKILRDESPESETYQRALRDLLDWRELHLPAMNEYYEKSQAIVNDLGLDDAIVAERLKRTPTILDKIQRFPHMKLTQLQDAAGIRIIVHSLEDVTSVEKRLQNLSPRRSRDYIAEPKSSGYRGKHFVYQSGDMLVEVQLRTYLQHLWATSLETVDFFRGTSMKTSQINTGWQHFFEIVSSLFAYYEKTPVLPQHSGMLSDELVSSLEVLAKKEKIFEHLATYSSTNVMLDDNLPQDAHYVILITDGSRNVRTEYFPITGYSDATDRYEALEAENTGNIVLVSVQNLKRLKRAYPNYFLNLKDFSNMVKILLDAYKDK